MSTERVREAAKRHVSDTNVPGLVALVARDDNVHVEAHGRLGIGRAPVRRDSLFRIASITKPVTAAVVITPRDLLTFTCGFGMADGTFGSGWPVVTASDELGLS